MTGTHGPGSSGNRFHFDYFDVWDGAQTPEGTSESPFARTWNWTEDSGYSGASGGTYYRDGTAMWYAFTGDLVTYQAVAASWAGQVEVSIDGITRDVVSLYNPTTITRTFAYTQVGMGPHVLQVRPATGRATVDAFLTPPAVRPVADFTAAPLVGAAPLTVPFTNQSVPTRTILAYRWDFGDGVTSTLEHPVHVYTDLGAYTVQLTATTERHRDTQTKVGYVTVVPTTAVVITYTYDGLSRLTHATYSGAYTATFAYAYDPAGNRTAYTQTVTDTRVTTYTYDAANRLVSAGGVPYTWDNNGNLTNDGSKTYTYDQANRLTGVSATGLTWSATYNGDGARLRQVVNAVPATYTLDLAAPLVQVLVQEEAGGKTAYLYGVTRVGEQQPAGWVYHLPDALGSVRQLADSDAQVVLARGYMPYGEALWSMGTSNSVYGFTGETSDVDTGLVFLRARYMQSRLGAFLAADRAPMNAMRPSDRGMYLYANGNPVNHTDPSGLCVFCDGGDSVKVDGRPDGELIVRARPDENAPEIARIGDNQRVRIATSRPTDPGQEGWRKVFVPGYEDGRPTMQVGWVKNLKLLDNCDGPSGTFACWPVTGGAPSTQGFGPNSYAKGECDTEFGTDTCPYNQLRGLHNGLDYQANIGESLVWMGTGNGTVVNRYGADAAPNIVVEFGGLGRDALFGHISASYVRAGQEVRPGQTIGQSGTDGSYAHLHLGVRSGRVFYNPLLHFIAALQPQIVSRMDPYAGTYDAYSMISYDADAADGANFWVDCPDFSGVVFYGLFEPEGE